MSHRLQVRNAAFCLALGTLLLAVACGGRALTEIETAGDGDARGGTSGRSGASGAPHDGSGVVSGAPGAAGAVSAAGAGSAAGTGSTCVCPSAGCGLGTRPVQLPGQCCPVCVDDLGMSCQGGKDIYSQFKGSLGMKYELGCTVADDCVAIAAHNSCEACGEAPAWRPLAESYQSDLDRFARSACAACKPDPEPPCLAPRAAYCSSGACRLFDTLQ